MQYLSRSEAAEFLTERGIPIAKTTLQKYATVGGGPEYQKFGNRTLYTQQSLLEWAQKKLSKPIKSSSEIDNGGTE